MQYDFRDTKCVPLEIYYGPISLFRNIEKYFVCTTIVKYYREKWNTLSADYESPLQWLVKINKSRIF